MFGTWILKMTHRLWNRQISRILCRAKEEGVINAEQLHQLTAAFDPTQRHIVYGFRVSHGFKGPRGVLASEKVDSMVSEAVNVAAERVRTEKPEEWSTCELPENRKVWVVVENMDTDRGDGASAHGVFSTKEKAEAEIDRLIAERDAGISKYKYKTWWFPQEHTIDQVEQ